MAVMGQNVTPARPRETHSHGEIQERLEHWRQALKTCDSRGGNEDTRREILAALDRWLDELADLRGC